MSQQALALAFAIIIGVTVWMLATSQVTAEERDEMLRDDEMWP